MDKEIKINRMDLIEKCEGFLAGRINKQDLERYASDLIFQDFFYWEDDTIADIVFQWDNEEINYPINATNIQLWKHRLETDEDLLQEYNNWSSHIEKQKEVCKKYNSKWNPINKKLFIGCSTYLLNNPIHGLRHPKEKNTTGWYMWAGEYSDADDFFKPLCAEHLLQIRPQIIKYLGLDTGFRFLADNKGYEDVWYDEKIKIIK